MREAQLFRVIAGATCRKQGKCSHCRACWAAIVEFLNRRIWPYAELIRKVVFVALSSISCHKLYCKKLSGLYLRFLDMDGGNINSVEKAIENWITNGWNFGSKVQWNTEHVRGYLQEQELRVLDRARIYRAVCNGSRTSSWRRLVIKRGKLQLKHVS